MQKCYSEKRTVRSLIEYTCSFAKNNYGIISYGLFVYIVLELLKLSFFTITLLVNWFKLMVFFQSSRIDAQSFFLAAITMLVLSFFDFLFRLGFAHYIKAVLQGDAISVDRSLILGWQSFKTSPSIVLVILFVSVMLDAFLPRWLFIVYNLITLYLYQCLVYGAVGFKNSIKCSWYALKDTFRIYMLSWFVLTAPFWLLFITFIFLIRDSLMIIILEPSTLFSLLGLLHWILIACMLLYAIFASFLLMLIPYILFADLRTMCLQDSTICRSCNCSSNNKSDRVQIIDSLPTKQ